MLKSNKISYYLKMGTHVLCAVCCLILELLREKYILIFMLFHALFALLFLMIRMAAREMRFRR